MEHRAMMCSESGESKSGNQMTALNHQMNNASIGITTSPPTKIQSFALRMRDVMARRCDLTTQAQRPGPREADGVSWTYSLLVPPCNGIQLTCDGHARHYANEREQRKDAGQEQDRSQQSRNGPNCEDMPKQSRLRVVRKMLIAPTPPMECIGGDAAEDRDHQDCWNIHNSVNPPNDPSSPTRPVGRHDCNLDAMAGLEAL